MRRLALAAASLAAVVGLAACGSPKSTASSPSSTSLPGSPSQASGGAPAPTAGPSTTLPAACGVSDAWGIAYLKATQNPVPPADQPGITATLDEKAAAYKAAVPELSADVAARTELAKKIMAGTATQADRDAETAARDKMNAWYGTTCSAK
ncbi:MAG: hypothetical protein U0Q07_19440 [Acidimicrobiales bacterium]